jgi:hypothetical protein
LLLNRRHRPEERESQPKPDPAEKSEVAIEDRDLGQLQHPVQRVPNAAHADDPRGDRHQGEDGGVDLQ